MERPSLCGIQLRFALAAAQSRLAGAQCRAADGRRAIHADTPPPPAGAPADKRCAGDRRFRAGGCRGGRSEEHTSELQSLMRISYAVFCLKKKKHNTSTQ